MFQHVLVPLDGSERAERALPLAVRLASASSGSLLLVRVTTESLYAPATLSNTFDCADGLVAPVNEAEAYLKAVAARPELTKIQIATCATIGTPAIEILQAARDNGVDAIVMCSHGRTGLAKWAMGSVAQKVARHSTVPVLVLKDGTAVRIALAATQGSGARMLIPLDGSPLAEAAIAPALELLARLGAGEPAEIHLLQVVDLATVYGRVGVDATRDQTVRTSITTSVQEYLSAMADEMLSHMPETGLNARVTWSIATGIDPATVVSDTAAGHSARASGEQAPAFDLIAMATHGRGGLGLWAVGSVAERVLTTSQVPLLIVRPPHEHGRTEVPTEVHEAPNLPPLL